MVSFDMPRAKQVVLLCVMLFGFISLLGEKVADERTAKERPRIYRGPYNETVLRSQYYSSSFFGCGGYYPSFYSPLMFLGPVVPVRSTVSFAVGSDGYVGTAFSTADVIKGTNIIYSLSASWEKGESYYLGRDYQMSTISPALSWSNGKTSLFLSVNISELNFDNKSGPLKSRPRVNTGPLRPGIPLARGRSPDLNFESINLGLSQRIWDNALFSIHLGEDVFGSDHLGVGFSQSVWQRTAGRHRY